MLRQTFAMFIVGMLFFGKVESYALEAVYIGHDMVDLCPFAPRTATNAADIIQVTLSRNGQIIYQGNLPSNRRFLYADTGLKCGEIYCYMAQYYPPIVPRGMSERQAVAIATVVVSTAICRGYLYNGDHRPSNRGPVVWTGTVAASQVYVVDGTLNINAGTVVTAAQISVGGQYFPEIPAGGQICAANATIDGVMDLQSNGNEITNCTVRVVWLYGESNLVQATTFNKFAGTISYLDITGNNNRLIGNTASLIYMLGSSNHIISNYFAKTIASYAVELRLGANSNAIYHNTIKGGMIIYSDHNTLCGNYFQGPGNLISGDPALTLVGSSNLIYNNYFSGWELDPGAEDRGNNNRWAIEKTLGRNIVGGAYLGGNFWAFYAGRDADGDGIGDTPHSIQGNAYASDLLPLMGPGELIIFSGVNNPNGSAIWPQGMPFVAAQVRAEAVGSLRENMTITSMTFTFEGDTNRIGALAGAGLFAGPNESFDNLRFIGTA